MNRFKFDLLTVTVALVSAGCSVISEQGKSTAVGAAIGAVGGAALSGERAIGAIRTNGGAALGGVVGNEVGK